MVLCESIGLSYEVDMELDQLIETIKEAELIRDKLSEEDIEILGDLELSEFIKDEVKIKKSTKKPLPKKK